jgi:hypothetical protein
LGQSKADEVTQRESTSDTLQRIMNEPPKQDPTPKPDIGQELALKKYIPVLAYLGTEATMFWSRSQLFLVAHSALLGFIGKDLPTSASRPDHARLGIFIAWAAVGLVLSALWHLAITVGSQWVDWWKEVLKELEPAAFGSTQLWRSRPKTLVPARRVARFAASLFSIVWLGLLVYLVILWTH